jgi:hypothetical protein
MNQQHLSSARQQIQYSPDAPSPGQRVLAIDAILDAIFSFSTPRTIISLSKTCRAARPIAASYFRVAYKPEHLLQQFLPDVASVCAFRSLQAQTGVTVFGKAAFNFLARAQLTEHATMSLYVDASYAPTVNRFLTEAGYDVETREHELVFFRMGEGEQVAREVVLHVGSPDSFDAVDKPRKLSSGAWCAIAPSTRLMKTDTSRFLQISLMSSRSTAHILFFRLNTTRNPSGSPCLPPSNPLED